MVSRMDTRMDTRMVSGGGLPIRRLEFLHSSQPKVGTNPMVVGRAKGDVRNEANCGTWGAKESEPWLRWRGETRVG
jgi:hypothetical protein